jgi:hypothetical protein
MKKAPKLKRSDIKHDPAKEAERFVFPADITDKNDLEAVEAIQESTEPLLELLRAATEKHKTAGRESGKARSGKRGEAQQREKQLLAAGRDPRRIPGIIARELDVTVQHARRLLKKGT